MTLFPSMNMLMQQSIPTAPCPPSPHGHLPALAVPGVGLLLILRDPGPGISQGGTPRAFDTHVVYISKTWRIFVVKISALWRIGQQGLEKIVDVFKGMLSEL